MAGSTRPPTIYVASNGDSQLAAGYNRSLDAGADHRSLAEVANKTMWQYVAPVILIVGLVGNTLVFLVVRRRSLRGTTTSLYLQLVAVADNACLVFSLFPDILEETDVVTIKDLHPATCKIQKFLQFVSLDIAVWLLAAFAFDRFIAVCFPFRKEHICRPKKAKLIALTLLLLAVAKDAHVFWTRGLEVRWDARTNSTVTKVCGRPTPEFAYFSYFVRPWIVFTMASVLPTCFLLVCNLWIVVELTRSRKGRVPNSSKKGDKTHRQMTAMCLSVSFVFIVCTIPSIIILIGKPWWEKQSPDAYTIAKGFNNLLVFVNHSINFIMYSVTGKKFREELRAILSCRPDVGGRRPSSWDRRNTQGVTHLTEADEDSDIRDLVPLTHRNLLAPPVR